MLIREGDAFRIMYPSNNGRAYGVFVYEHGATWPTAVPGKDIFMSGDYGYVTITQTSKIGPLSVMISGNVYNFTVISGPCYDRLVNGGEQVPILDIVKEAIQELPTADDVSKGNAAMARELSRTIISGVLAQEHNGVTLTTMMERCNEDSDRLKAYIKREIPDKLSSQDKQEIANLCIEAMRKAIQRLEYFRERSNDGKKDTVKEKRSERKAIRKPGKKESPAV